MLQVIDIKCALVKTLALSILRTNGKTDSLVITEGEFIERLLYARDGKICCVTGMVKEIRPIEKPVSRLRTFYNNPMSDNNNGYYITIDASTLGMSNIIRITSMDIRGIVTDPDHQCPPYEDSDEPIDPDMGVDPITPEQLQQILQETVTNAVKDAVSDIDNNIKDVVGEAVDNITDDFYTKKEVDTVVNNVVESVDDKLTWKDLGDEPVEIPPTEEDPITPPVDEDDKTEDTPSDDEIPDTLPDEDGTTITIPVEDFIESGVLTARVDDISKEFTSITVEPVVEDKILDMETAPVAPKVIVSEPTPGIIRRCVTNPM